MPKLLRLCLKITFLCFAMFLSYVVQAQGMYKVVPLNNLQDGDRVILSVKGTDGFMYPSTNNKLHFGKQGTTLPYGESSVWWAVERNGEYWRFKNVETNDYLAVEENWTGTNGTLKSGASDKDWELVEIPGVVGGFSLRNREKGHTGLIWETKYYDIIPMLPSNGDLFGLTNSTTASHTNRTPLWVLFCFRIIPTVSSIMWGIPQHRLIRGDFRKCMNSIRMFIWRRMNKYV